MKHKKDHAQQRQMSRLSARKIDNILNGPPKPLPIKDMPKKNAVIEECKKEELEAEAKAVMKESYADIPLIDYASALHEGDKISVVDIYGEIETKHTVTNISDDGTIVELKNEANKENKESEAAKKQNTIIVKSKQIENTEKSKIPKPHPVMRNNDEYDTLKPETKIKEFVEYLKSCVRQYMWDQEHLDLCERKMQDILHYAEMAEKRNSKIGYKVYKELAAVRKERRACKNEIQLLSSVYDMCQKSNIMNQLTMAQGSCRSVRETIEGKWYTARTDILDQFMEVE